MSLPIPEFSLGPPWRNRQVWNLEPQIHWLLVFEPITCDERYILSGKSGRDSLWLARYMGKKFL